MSNLGEKDHRNKLWLFIVEYFISVERHTIRDLIDKWEPKSVLQNEGNIICNFLAAKIISFPGCSLLVIPL